MHEEISTLKAKADEKIGALMQRLNDCGPKGNRSVEQELDFWRGRSAALADVLPLAAENDWTDEVLMRDRDRLSAALPACPSHGSGCTPYAVAWIEKAWSAGVELDEAEVPRMSAQQHAQLDAALTKLSR